MAPYRGGALQGWCLIFFLAPTVRCSMSRPRHAFEARFCVAQLRPQNVYDMRYILLKPNILLVKVSCYPVAAHLQELNQSEKIEPKSCTYTPYIYRGVSRLCEKYRPNPTETRSSHEIMQGLIIRPPLGTFGATTTVHHIMYTWSQIRNCVSALTKISIIFV